jgi:hypothetical protein
LIVGTRRHGHGVFPSHMIPDVMRLKQYCCD